MFRTSSRPRFLLTAAALAAALLGTACSDSTAPSGTGNGADAGASAKQRPGGTSTPPSDRPPAPTKTVGRVGGTQTASSGIKPDFLRGDVGACKWSGNWCLRQLDAGLGYPVYLDVEFNRGGSNAFVYIWIWMWDRGWIESYALRNSDLAVWYKFNGIWYRYQPYAVTMTGGQVSITPGGMCGTEMLCQLDMLDANRVLPNGKTVQWLLWKLTYGL
jgi:hypothetical protein